MRILVGHCVRLLPSVSLCCRSCLLSCWSLCPPCLPSVSFCFPSCCAVPTSALQSFPFVSQLWTAVLQSFTCPPAPDCCVRLSLAILDICLPDLGCCVRLSLAILHNCPRSPLQLPPSSRLLYPPLPCSPLFVSQLWAACRLQSFTFVSLCLHLSPSSGLLWPSLPCNPLSPSSGRRKL